MKLTYVLDCRDAPPSGAPLVLYRHSPARWRRALVLALLLAALTLLALSRAGPAAGAAPSAIGAWAPDVALAAAPQSAAPAGDDAVHAAKPGAESASTSWVQHTVQGLSLDVRRVSRRALVEELAAATGTQLIGSTAGLDATSLVSLHWRGRDSLQLWAVLLEGHVNFAAQCDGLGCRVWLLDAGSGAPPAGQAEYGGQQHVLQHPGQAHSQSPLLPDPPGLFPAD